MIKKLASRKGISPILATLLLISIAVGAIIITYAWVITFTSTQTEQSGAVLIRENIRFYNVSFTKYVEVVIRNSGTADAKVVTVYVGTSSAALIQKSFNDVSYDPSTQIAIAGESLNITITHDWVTGTRYYFKVVTDAGQQLPFNAKA
ncbi:MAG: hypothetical protein JSV12_09350 [Candidatus Bathyarchaeota archaeon]|nr:MAG: hypothetical protein JSV12_09350 [Candidatus Bathyarchaeota archaeon]